MKDHVDRKIGRQVLGWAYRRSDDPASPISHVVMFWILMAAAACLFAAAVLVPVWAEHQEIQAAKARAQQRLETLRSELTRKQAIAKALREDPMVNEHTALREMNYHMLGQEVIRTQPEQVVPTAPPPKTIEPPVLFPRLAALSLVPEKWLRLDTWIGLVLKPEIRRGMLIGAAFLSAVAFVAFAPPTPGGKVMRLLRRT